MDSKRIRDILTTPENAVIEMREEMIFDQIYESEDADKFFKDDFTREFFQAFLKINKALPGNGKAKKTLSELEIGFLDVISEKILREKSKAQASLWERWEKWLDKKIAATYESTDEESSQDNSANTISPSYSPLFSRRSTSPATNERESPPPEEMKQPEAVTLLPGMADNLLTKNESAYLLALADVSNTTKYNQKIQEDKVKFKVANRIQDMNFSNSEMMADNHPMDLCKNAFQEYAKHRKHKETADRFARIIGGWEIYLLPSSFAKSGTEKAGEDEIIRLIADGKITDNTIVLNSNLKAYLIESKGGKMEFALLQPHASIELAASVKKHWKQLRNNVEERKVQRNAETIPAILDITNQLVPTKDPAMAFQSFELLLTALNTELLAFMKANNYKKPPGILPTLIHTTIKNLEKLNATLHAKLDTHLQNEYGALSTITYGPSGTTIATNNKRNTTIRLSFEETQEKLRELLDARMAERKISSQQYKIEFSSRESRSHSASSSNPLSARDRSPASSNRAASDNDSQSGNTLKVPTRKHG